MAAYQDPRRRPRKSKYARLDNIDTSRSRFKGNAAPSNPTPSTEPAPAQPSQARENLNSSLPEVHPVANNADRLQHIPPVDSAEQAPKRNPLASDRIPRIPEQDKPAPSPTPRRSAAHSAKPEAAPSRRRLERREPSQNAGAKPTARSEAKARPRKNTAHSGHPTRRPGARPENRQAPKGRPHASAAAPHSGRPGDAPLQTKPSRSQKPKQGASAKQAKPSKSNKLAATKRGRSPELPAAAKGKRATGSQSRKAAAAGSAAAAATGVFAAVGGAARRGFGGFGSWFANRFRTSRRFAVISSLIIVLLAAGVVDFALNHDKIYANVSIGEVNVSGMTEDQAAEALRNTYSSRITGASIKIYSDQDTMNSANSGQDINNIEASEDVSTDEATANRKVWSTDASTLQARMEYSTLAKQAYEVGRSDGSILGRLYALFFGRNLDATVSMNDSALAKLGTSIDKTLGKLRKNYDIKVTDGKATVTSGHDGNEVNLDWLRAQLQQRFTDNDNSASADSFVAQIDYAPLQITQDMAQSVAGQVNDAIDDGATFTFEDKSWTASATQLGNWITTDVEKDGDSYRLNVGFKKDKAKSVILKHITPKFDSDDVKVTFEKSGNDGVTVHTSATGNMPVISSALDTLQKDLFSDGADHSQAPTVAVESMAIPESMSVQAALDYGIITVVSSYTTEYTADADARNHNIHLAADLLDNSIIKANGGQWSFNNTAGECNADKGFEGAGVIIDGETVDEIGGGICQVATTVFNAVYEGGFDVVTRHNHSLYIASYPDGRDAAIGWPDLDLVWDNDSTSDLLMRTSHTDTTVTVELLGVSDGRTVTTQTGAWKEGEKYSTETQTDSSLAKGYSYVKQTGSDGKSITVVRTVKSAKGKVLHKDTFSSVYDARDEIIVKGTAS
jgi:vancomycin resistance protein YoaR